jgi:hypothetical protein
MNIQRLFRGMKKWALGMLLLPCGRAGAQDPFAAYPTLFKTPLHYVCYSTPDSMIIDGKADEPAWQKAPWTEDFSDIEGGIRPKPSLRTRARMLWDKRNLYIYAELEEPELQGGLLQHDTIIYQDNDFEVFLNPDNTTHNYFELEFNALGTVMDLFMFRPYRDEGKALMSWDAQGMRSAVSRRGTLNRPGDKDGGWSVEMAIPLSTLRFFGERPPRDSTLWRINFSRVEWDWDVKEDRYVKRVDPANGRSLPEHNWVWSPQGIVDMHAPERWGYLQFSARPAGSGPVVFVLPAEEKARDYLWLIYYKQRDYRRAYGSYALKLGELGFSVLGPKMDAPNNFVTEIDEQGQIYTFRMEGLSAQYTAVISGEFKGELTIDQDGKVGRRP